MYAVFKREVSRNIDSIDVMLQYLSISRSLERIADHATNIAEDVVYITEGDIVRHRINT
jgi:phosphate transport system protein